VAAVLRAVVSWLSAGWDVLFCAVTAVCVDAVRDGFVHWRALFLGDSAGCSGSEDLGAAHWLLMIRPMAGLH